MASDPDKPVGAARVVAQDTPGAKIRSRREAQGLSVAELAASTGIPEAHVEAIEGDRWDDLPAGPYASVYVRFIQQTLGLSEGEEALEPATGPVGPTAMPLWVVRALAGGSLAALALLLVTLGWERIRPDPDGAHAEPVADQHLLLSARQDTHLTVRIDGILVLDREVVRGEALDFEAADRIEVDLLSTSHVRIEWNGITVVPQGRQDTARRLVFADDRGAQW